MNYYYAYPGHELAGPVCFLLRERSSQLARSRSLIMYDAGRTAHRAEHQAGRTDSAGQSGAAEGRAANVKSRAARQCTYMQPSETVSRAGTDGIGRYRPYVVCCNDVSVKSSGEPVSVGFSLLAHMSVLPVHEAIKSDATCRGTIETFLPAGNVMYGTRVAIAAGCYRMTRVDAQLLSGLDGQSA